MTISSERAPASDTHTTALPSHLDMAAVLPELSTPQERYDHGFKRGYMAGYAEGARQAQAERAAELAAHKTAWASTQARASALLGQLSSASEEYLSRFGPRDVALTDQLLSAAFDLAQAIVAHELRTSPGHAAAVARSVLADLPTGPVTVRVNPADEGFVRDAADSLGRRGQQVDIVADPSVGPGGCAVSSGARFVDARVEQALARARLAFVGAPEDDREVGPADGTRPRRAETVL